MQRLVRSAAKTVDSYPTEMALHDTPDLLRITGGPMPYMQVQEPWAGSILGLTFRYTMLPIHTFPVSVQAIV